MNKFLKSKLSKGFVVLLSVLLFGIPRAHAAGIVTSLFGAIGGILADAGAGIVEGIANLLKMLIQALGGIFYFVANAAVDFAMKMNFLLPSPDNLVLRDGFSIVLAVANIALVAGILVIAFAVMVRADWLSEARTALPKFITAALLINFSLFIGINLIIVPVNEITKSIYSATGFDQNSFRGPFNVDLDLGSLLQTQLALSRAQDNEFEPIEQYFELREQLQSDIYDLLVTVENERFVDLPPLALGSNAQLRDTNFVTKSQREEVSSGVMKRVEGYLARSQISGLDALKSGLPPIESWSDLEKYVAMGISDSGASYARSDAYKPGYSERDLLDSIMGLARNAFSPMCPDIEDLSAAECAQLNNVLSIVLRPLNAAERVVIALVEVLFEGIFVFLGSFSLLGLASMLFLRYIALNLLLILFPLAWIGWIFPKLAAAGGGKDIWKAWWSHFIKWVLFGPFVTFFLFLAVRGSLMLDKITPPASETYNGASSIGILAASVGNLLTVLGLLIGGMHVAHKMGIMGSSLFYGSMKKMRDRVGKKIKGISKKLVDRYPGRAWKATKEAANARRVQLTSARLRTEGGRARTQRWAEDGNRIQRLAARKRIAKIQNAQDLLKEREKRRLFMHKDSNGAWKDNAPYLNSQILTGFIAHPGSTSEGALAAAFELLGEGKILPFESPVQGLLARIQGIPNFVDHHGLQKAQNSLRKMGFSGRAEAAAQAAEDAAAGGPVDPNARYAILDGLVQDLGGRAIVRSDPDTYHPGAANSGGAGTDEVQRAKVDAKNDLYTVHRPDQVAANFAGLIGVQKADLLAASSGVVVELTGAVNTGRPGFAALADTQLRLEAIDGLTPGQLQAIHRGANPNGSALHRLIRRFDPATHEGRVGMRRALRAILSNNANLIGQSSMLGAFIGGMPPGTPGTP